MGNEKMSSNKCKAILQKDGSVYTDKEIIEIRDFLYKLAEMDYEVFSKLRKKEEAFEREKQETTLNESNGN
ncbi:MAG: hypothetical protein ABI388_02330 [Bacteroidia bacterium]